MTMGKRIVCFLCVFAILSFSCIFVPKTNAIKMQIETEAMSLVVAGGLTLAAAVAVVLLWYGISVNTTDTSQSVTLSGCVSYVQEKIAELEVSSALFLLNIGYYMSQLVSWVGEWVSGNASSLYDAVYNSIFQNLTTDGYAICIDNSSIASGTVWAGVINSISDSKTQTLTFTSCGGSYPVYYVFCKANSYSSDYWCYGFTFDTSGADYVGYFSLSGSANATLFPNTYVNDLYSYGYVNYGNTSAVAYALFQAAGIGLTYFDGTLEDYIGSTFLDESFESVIDQQIGVDATIVIPAAEDVITTYPDSYALDLPDVLDVDGILSLLRGKYGSLTWDDVITGVNTGAISINDVLTASDVVPYIAVDTLTGEIATADTAAENVKYVSLDLDSDLTLPSSDKLVDAVDYVPQYSGSYSYDRFPLFQFFPFCLPYDLYDFLSQLDVEPIAPVWEIDTSPIFEKLAFFKEDDGYTLTVDLTEYEEIFEIIRIFECIGIVIGLVFLSRKLIHGGD